MKGSLAIQLERHVITLCDLGPRVLQRPLAIRATVGYIEHSWNEFGLSVRHENFEVCGQRADNLYVEIAGTRHPEQFVVLGAHYDTVDTTPGADDNASAVAVLLEVSRRLAKLRGERSIRLIAFACEEPPYFNVGAMGSQHHARECRRRKEKIVGMLCLEMVGYYRGDQEQVLPPSVPRWLRLFVPKQANFLAAVGNFRSARLLWNFRGGFKQATNFPLCCRCLPSFVPEIWLSDHRGFWEQGYPAIMLTDTSFLRNPHYHLPSDLPNTLNYQAMADVVEGVFAAVCSLARVPKHTTSGPMHSTLTNQIVQSPCLGDVPT